MPEFLWIANHPGLDLVNTEIAGEHGDRVDLLRGPTDLLEWIDIAGLAAQRPLRRAGRDRRRAPRPDAVRTVMATSAQRAHDQTRIVPADAALGARINEAMGRAAGLAADELLTWTRHLRAAARQLLDPVVPTTDQAVRELDALVGAVPVRLAHPDVASAPPLTTPGDVFDELRLHLARAVLDALQLDRTYLRRCGGDRCILLFYDTSRTRSRRWCDMSACGNRAKATAHYRRHKRPGHSP